MRIIFVPFVTLDFDAPIFHGASHTTGFLHLLRKILFLRQPDAGKLFGHGDSLAAAMRGLADNVHPATVGVFLPALRGFSPECLERYRGEYLRSRRQIAQPCQRTKKDSVARPLHRWRDWFFCFGSGPGSEHG